MDRDLDSNGRKVFHAVAVFDDDNAGRRACSAITGQHLNYTKWRDVFILKRFLPRTTRDPSQLPELIQKANEDWVGVDCEIEDLLAADFVDAFTSETPNSVFRPTDRRAEGARFFINRDKKGALVRFAEENAMYSDVFTVVELLKSIRFHLGLPEDGD